MIVSSRKYWSGNDTISYFEKLKKSGRFAPELPAAFLRNRWQVYNGITGRLGAECAFIK
jgi:hypothetical protein